MKRFWEVEEVPAAMVAESQRTADEKAAQDIVSAGLTKSDDKYTVPLPWKGNRAELPDNAIMAEKRLRNTEHRLKKDTAVGEAYSNVIESYVKKGYVRKVPPTKVSTTRWLLPHFPVLRPDKSTTKLGIVFDAAARCQGDSLNEHLHAGPKLQRSLFDVLLRFRQHPVAIVCDISEMYLQVKVAPADRPCLRFLWRNLDTSKPPDTYEFERVVFGLCVSPFLAQFVAQEHARRHREESPRAAESILDSTYMDDTLDSVETVADGKKLYHDLSAMWAGASMSARKWLSNAPEVLEAIPAELRAAEINLESGELPAVKALGILWKAAEDVLTFRPATSSETISTKRQFLQRISQLFDPLGLIAPVVVQGKIIMQDIWTSGTNWDEELNPLLKASATRWFQQLQQLVSIRVPRCLSLTNSQQQLHVFADASSLAYGAAVYMRSQDSSDVAARFVAAKSRVAPLQAISIPRLELMAAVTAAELGSAVASATQLQLQNAVFWTDSMDVFHWVRQPSRQYKPFIAHRIGYIQTLTRPGQWRYVPTALNPADLVSRGATVTNLAESSLWWEGPAFLLQPSTEWPQPAATTTASPTAAAEVRKTAALPSTFASVTTSNTDTMWRLTPERYSDFQRLVRITGLVLRFISNVSSNQRATGELTVSELQDAERLLFKGAQAEAFGQELQALANGKALPASSVLSKLSPRVDEDGLLRCDGQTKYAEWLPVILPRHHHITKLVVKHHHELQQHGGTNQTLSSVCERFWIVAAREVIREWEHECARCIRTRAKPAEQVMAPLPKSRLEPPLRAFAKTAVDFAGPYITIQGRGRARQKRYLCLFTCLLSRAVHLELAYGLDTDSFLRAFSRFAHRRGLPVQVLSDNGTNFIGANRELRELVDALDKDAIQRSAANRKMDWSFNPPLAPHFGGAHEAMIKSAKRATAKILGNADITDEELMTAFTGAEALLNSRPLTFQSANPADVSPLTPNHFLIGQAGGQYAPESVDTQPFHPRNRWRRIQELLQHFWQRWLTEWVPALNQRRKWFAERKDVSCDDVVLVIQPDSPRGQWPLGRVTQTFPGADGKVRVVEVQVAGKRMTRPITKVCPLEFVD
eukprot:scpid35165/ scgid17425/ 